MARSNGRRRRNRPSRNSAVQAVTIVDGSASSNLSRVNRILSNQVACESDIMTICTGTIQLDAVNTGTPIAIGYSNIAATDDFNSFGAQFNSFSIRHIKFDIYDQAPLATNVGAYWSTIHTGGAAIPTQTLSDVVDRPDSQAVAPGMGKATLVWSAHTTGELDFYDFNAGPEFGGLTGYITPITTTITQKYLVIYKAVVHFRGRR